jgi:ParB family chromosome partitioning protein
MPKRPEIKALDLSVIEGGPATARHPVDTFTDDADAGRIVNIPVAAITPSPDQPRKHFDEQALAELTTSVRERGVLQPIIVRRAGQADRFILVAGERRWRAASAAGLPKIPALIRQREDPVELALIENLQREDLNPIEEAEALHHLKELRHLTDEQIARIIGKSRPAITETLTLTRLPEAIKAQCRTSDNHPKSLLLSLVRAPNSEAQLTLWQAIKTGSLTVREARKATSNDPTKPGPKPYRFTYKPDKPTFTVQVTFRKSRASHDEIKDALREALKSLT